MLQHRKIVGLTALGGALEFYDFTIYALFTPYLAAHFFSHSTKFVAILQTFLVFALGYFARPFGGIIFGHFGDRYGRKAAFSFSVLLMAVATLLMGCLPDDRSIGMLAPIGLICLRLLQGISVGGEIPGAAIFIFEHVSFKRRGLSNGILFMSITLGNTLGAMLGLLLTSVLDHAQMLSWGWRIPFLIGFVLGLISYVLRKNAYETPAFLAMMQENQLQDKPLVAVLNSSKNKLFNALMLTATSACLISFFLYLPTYLSTVLKINLEHAYLINLLTFLSFALATAFFGFISDYIDRGKIITSGAVLLILCSYPIFHGLMLFSEGFIWLFVFCLAVFGGMINSCYVISITESFPAQCRYSGVGFSYSLGIALFGGISPLAFTGLIHILNFQEAPFMVVMVCAVLTLIANLKHKSSIYLGKAIAT